MRAFSPAMIFALFVGLAAFAVAAFAPGLLNDSDTYWHIRAGEWMLAHHQLLRADVFSYTASGTPWHTQEWLAEIVMALAWSISGWSAIHLLFAACAALTAGIVGYFVRARVDFVPALLTVVLGLSCVAGSLLARPHIVALPLLALWTAGLAAAREQERAPHWALLAVMPLWANLHGSFAFGLALAGALGIEAVIASADRKLAILRWGLFLVAAAAVSTLTPFGIQTLLFPLRLTAMRGIAHIGEWQASDFSHLSPFAIALLVTIGALATGRIRVGWTRLAILLAILWLALSHSRHQMLLGVTAPILLVPSLALPWPARPQDGKPLFAALTVAGFAVLIIARLAWPAARGDDPASPVTALNHVPRFVREMPVVNDYSFGGYLIWNRIKPFIDSRADLYGDIFLENYAAVIAPDKDALAATLAYHHARWTIFRADQPVVKLLDATQGWHRLYADKLAVVHVHD
jgi:hypothetical protein